MIEYAPPAAVPQDDDPPTGRTFEELFRAERRRLYRAVFLLARDGHEADDIVQQAFCKVWERWDRVRVMDDPRGYLYRTAMNEFRSRLRRARVAARRMLPGGGPDDPMGRVDTVDEVRRALARLTTRQRTALVLTEILELSSKEASGILGISPGAVRTLVTRARRALARREQA